METFFTDSQISASLAEDFDQYDGTLPPPESDDENDDKNADTNDEPPKKKIKTNEFTQPGVVADPIKLGDSYGISLYYIQNTFTTTLN